MRRGAQRAATVLEQIARQRRMAQLRRNAGPEWNAPTVRFDTRPLLTRGKAARSTH
jgi:hypothetical protein